MTGRKQPTGTSGQQAGTGAVRLSRAYHEPEPEDGYRVLVDRLWPRGLTKEGLALDAWMKGVGPSDELRRWFGHDPSRWVEFETRYRDELQSEPVAPLVSDLVTRARHGPITLVYGAKDELHNQAVVLREVICEKLSRDKAREPRASHHPKERAHRRAG